MAISSYELKKFFPEEFIPLKGWRGLTEKRLKLLLEKISTGKFLEVGMGPNVRLDRAKHIKELEISYTGLDYTDVCEMHKKSFIENNINGSFRFVKNNRGNYLYNLIKLHRKKEKFDLIYVDGHHTMYIDFAAAMACLPLLKAGSYIAFDDVRWCLSEKELSLKENPFYKSIYDFDLYEEDEKKDRHIGIIIKDYLLPYYNLSLVEELCCPGWLVLKAGSSWQFDK